LTRISVDAIATSAQERAEPAAIGVASADKKLNTEDSSMIITTHIPRQESSVG
jgi:hypothetical protein